MDKKRRPNPYDFSAEADRINSELGLSVQVMAEDLKAAHDFLSASRHWGSENTVGPLDGPAVPEPKPFDCPVCDRVGFDCGGHG